MPNRYICSVLEEMRTAHRTRNYSYMTGLIEEAQSLANRMEASLEDAKDFEIWLNQIKEKKAEHKALVKEIKKLREEKLEMSR